MPFDILSARSGSAASNMATDFLMLQHYPVPTHARFRHYGWNRPAVTFGYSQKMAWVRSQLPTDEPLELCRRPTGGGIVDHRDDWTYAVVIPPGHALYDARAVVSYEAVHRALAASLNALGATAAIKEVCQPDPDCAAAAAGPGVCFDKAELFDVIHAGSGRKIAGAAQKRAKRGLLFQGSIARAVVGEIDWEAFAESFGAGLGAMLGMTAELTPWPEAWDEAIDALAESYATPEWNERR